MGDSKIEWTEKTWNPVRGCSRVSEGCRNCYAEREAVRLSGPGRPYEGLVQMANGHPQWTGKVVCDEDKLDAPLRWKKPARIFVNSMADLFHPEIPDDFIRLVCRVMQDAPQHVFQILTKRPERMKEWSCFGKPSMSHVWLGVSVEDQKSADERVPLLMQTPAAVRWISYEPALGPVSLEWLSRPGHPDRHFDALSESTLDGRHSIRLNWVVCGGESGPHARPMHPHWASSVRDQCVAAGVPFFFKQWGEWEPSFKFEEQFADVPLKTPVLLLAKDGHIGYSQAEMQGHPHHVLMVKTGKRRAGRLLDGREWNQYPQVIHEAVAG
jgi:protein gp37